MSKFVIVKDAWLSPFMAHSLNQIINIPISQNVPYLYQLNNEWYFINLNYMAQVHHNFDEINTKWEAESSSPCRRSSFSQFLYNTLTNASYSIKHNNFINIPYFQREIIHLNQNSNPVFFLGKTFVSGQEEKFQRQFQNTNWFSYRKNIKSIGDDSGWGCMIRASQMLLANVLRKTLNLRSDQTIEYFKENQNAMFSLSNICKQGQIKRRSTSSSEVIYICKQILDGQSNPNFSIHSNNIGMIQYQTVKNHFQRSNLGLLLSFHCQLGVQKIDEQTVPYLKTLMAFSQFVGCLGGPSGYALYLMGHQSDLFVCLDPHYVQQADAGIETYFKTHPRGIHYTKLSGSICINFLLLNMEECNKFMKKLVKLNEGFKGRNILTASINKQARTQIGLLDLESQIDDDEEYQVIGQ